MPSRLEVSGENYPIDPDFKNCLRIIMAYEDEELTSLEKQSILLANLFDVVPADTAAAIERANWFLGGGSDSEGGEDGAPGYRLYSFSKDAGFIFSAFRQTHGIDLEEERFHWWKFLALFLDLGADTVFCNLVGLRKRVKNGTASKEEKKMALEMGDMFDLPEVDDRTPEEREAERIFLELVSKGQ